MLYNEPNDDHIQGVTGRPEKKNYIMLHKRMEKIVKIIWLVNNLGNILMSGNSPKKKYLKKVIML